MYIYNIVSTIRIRNEDKQQLEALINFIAFKTNKRLTQEEMIALLVRTGTNDKTKLLAALTITPEEDYIWESNPIFNAKPLHLGKNASQTIDQELYRR